MRKAPSVHDALGALVLEDRDFPLSLDKVMKCAKEFDAVRLPPNAHPEDERIYAVVFPGEREGRFEREPLELKLAWRNQLAESRRTSQPDRVETRVFGEDLQD
jgi:hypothetical protein